MTDRAWRRRVALCGPLVVLLASANVRAGDEADTAPASARVPSYWGRSLEAIYANYRPDFIDRDVRRWEKRGQDDPLKLSYQKRFFNMSVLKEDSRVDALIAAGREREEKGEYRDAMKIYRLVIDDYPDVLYRVAENGIFAPARVYCQRRLLGFPPNELKFYRTLHDAPARDAFERARRRYSLLDLREVADTMLATSYGARALFELANAALDIGRFEEALDHYEQVWHQFPDAHAAGGPIDHADLALRIAYCRTSLGLGPWSENASPPKPGPARAGASLASTNGLSSDQRSRLQAAMARIDVKPRAFNIQRATPPHDSVADFKLFAPTDDPINLKPTVWQVPLSVSHRTYDVFFYPVATEDSLIYRYKNIVYCRSLLSGELRWTNALGGRVDWINRDDAFFPSEEVLVQDGLVFTNMYKSGASLVALDEVTGQLRWAHGPIAPVYEEDSRTSYFACPAGGRRTVYASYIIDNIEGETHLDTVYGLRAFDSTTGRILWSRELCRLNVGKFMLSELITIRNRIRSYATPPTLHEGTLYYVSNAGVAAAVTASTGTVKWATRYPYLRLIHDRTRALRFLRLNYRPPLYFGELAQPLWYNQQRPLIDGDRMFVLPVDADYILCMERRTGKILWSRIKGGMRDRNGRWMNGRETYMVGLIPAALAGGPSDSKKKYLVVVYTGANESVHLLDADTGLPVWQGKGLFDSFASPEHSIEAIGPRHGTLQARPFMTTEGKLYIPRHNRFHGGGMRYGIYTPERRLYWVVDLKARKTIQRRLYYDGQYMSLADRHIRYAQRDYDDIMKNYPDRKPEPFWTTVVMRYKDEEMPTNIPASRGPFYPFSRMTFVRHGVQFELFVEPRVIKMKYDRSALARALSGEK